MAITISNVGGQPIADYNGATSGALTGSLTAVAGVAVDAVGGGRPMIISADLNVHGPTGSLVTVQIFDAVASVTYASVQVTLGGQVAADDYRVISCHASVFTPGVASVITNNYGFELLAQVTGGSANVIGGGISVVIPVGTRTL